MKRKFIIFIFGFTFFSPFIYAWNACQAPPIQHPQHRKAGESFPPLPLPATPLRRTEKKNPPAPPILVGKVICGPDNKWGRAGNDIDNLLNLASIPLGVRYRAIRVNLNNFSFDPDKVPILYISSFEAYTPNKKLFPKIRKYLQEGGFIWLNSILGSPDFTRSSLQWLSQIYPHRALYRAYSNHPLLTCFYNLSSVKIMRYNVIKNSKPDLLVLNIGARAAVIFSKECLACGWCGDTTPAGVGYMPKDAVKIGINMLVYCLGWMEYGRMYPMIALYSEKTKRKEGKIYIGQLINSGNWDPNPSGLEHLLKRVARVTGAGVYIKNISINLNKDSLKNIPILYMTGQFNPKLGSEELKKLKQFLLSGGTLIADSSCGSNEFTQDFKKIIPEILPGAKKVIWNTKSPVYNVPFHIKFNYTIPEKNPPAPLEAYIFHGFPAIIFSPYGIGDSWNGLPEPYTKIFSPSQSTELGVNLITYIMTH
ncbi:MAG: DUF4159 domain-containing protein [Candidatus Omnitrophica bacterium]|jgi:hypothetical protein|nr:DUF4159 domain-containing protein [Candidatus Omnitrophota bacterium]